MQPVPGWAPTLRVEHDLPAVDACLHGRLGADRLSGVAVAITCGDRFVHVAGYGDLNADTRFPICSLSKSFTAVAVLQLVDAGKLALWTTPHVTTCPPGTRKA